MKISLHVALMCAKCVSLSLSLSLMEKSKSLKEKMAQLPQQLNDYQIKNQSQCKKAKYRYLINVYMWV